MTEHVRKDESCHRRNVWVMILCSCALVVAVFVAYRIHRYRHGPAAPSNGRRVYLPTASLATPPGRRPTTPADPLAVTGVRVFSGDLVDHLLPPAGAARWSAFQLPDGSVQVKYEYQGELAAVAAHYLKKLKAAGLKLLGDGSDAFGQRRITCAARDTQVTVGLRNNRSNIKIVTIIVTVAQTASSCAAGQ